MHRLLVITSASIAASIIASNSYASTVVRCEDGTKKVSLNLTFAKKDSPLPPSAALIISNGKSKGIDQKNLLRFIRNANDFYLLFKVQTKTGLQELELNTRFNKNPRGPRSSSGVLVNKTQNESLSVICRF